MDDPSTPHRSTDRFKTDTSADTSADMSMHNLRGNATQKTTFFLRRANEKRR